jgi:hypothetical protein
MKGESQLASAPSLRRKIGFSRIAKSRRSLRSLVYILLFFIVAQVAAAMAVNLGTVYHYRINYNMFLDNPRTLTVVLDEMEKKIKQDKLSNYIILIGNSVSWGTNESSEHSLGRYLDDEAKQAGPSGAEAVFNLSLPSIKPGDAYTLLLMLEERGIKTDNVILGLTYSAFAEEPKGAKAVFWLGDDLRRVDPEAFAHVLPQLKTGRYKYKEGWKHTEEELLRHTLYQLPSVKYIDPIKFKWKQDRKGTDLLGDPRPWSQKGHLLDKLNDPQYLRFFNPDPFIMTMDNWGVYFMNRIAEHQEGKRTLVFVTGGNEELSKKEVNNPSYVANLSLIDQYLAGTSLEYVMLEKQIKAEWFTDHIHLTKEGNQLLARLIWDSWMREGA